MWTIGMLIFNALWIVFCTSSSTPCFKGFLWILRATISTLHRFLSIMVYKVRLHYFMPETISFLAFVGFWTFRIACLYASLFMSLRARSYSCSFGTFLTHSLKIIFWWFLPVSLPICMYFIVSNYYMLTLTSDALFISLFLIVYLCYLSLLSSSYS